MTEIAWLVDVCGAKGLVVDPHQHDVMCHIAVDVSILHTAQQSRE